MDFGDYGYVIFLAIVGIANFLRARNKQIQAKKEEAQQRQAPSRGTRSIPVPQEPEEDPFDGRYHRDEAKTGTSATATGDGRYKREPSKIPANPSRSPEPEVSDWREMMTEMLEGEATQDQTPPPILVAASPAPAMAKTSAARGMREGESVAEYAARTRRESSAKFTANLLAENDGIKRDTGSLDFDPDFRNAVIYDAIFRPPYI